MTWIIFSQTLVVYHNYSMTLLHFHSVFFPTDYISWLDRMLISTLSKQSHQCWQTLTMIFVSAILSLENRKTFSRNIWPIRNSPCALISPNDCILIDCCDVDIFAWNNECDYTNSYVNEVNHAFRSSLVVNTLIVQSTLYNILTYFVRIRVKKRTYSIRKMFFRTYGFNVWRYIT